MVSLLPLTVLQKIDSLKEELSAMLRKDILDESLDDYGLDSDWEEEDIAELQAIGILPSSSSQRKKPSRHIIFTENESEGKYVLHFRKPSSSFYSPKLFASQSSWHNHVDGSRGG